MRMPTWNQPPASPAAEPAPPAAEPAPPAAPAEPSAPSWDAPSAESTPTVPSWGEPPPAPPAAEPPAAEESAPSGWGEPAPAEGSTDLGGTMSIPTWTPPPAQPPPAPPAPAAPTGDAAGLDRTIFVDSTAVAGAGAAGAPAGAPSLAEGELVIASGPDSGHSFKISGPAIRIGRAPDNDLVLRDPATSGHHARVERRGNQFYVVDLGSTNGTLVNGEVVMERELKNGDSITIGQNAVNFAVH